MVEAGMSDEALKLAKALLSQMHTQNEVLKLIIKTAPGLSTPALMDIIQTGDILMAEVLETNEHPKPAAEPQTPNDVFAASNVFPINTTKH